MYPEVVQPNCQRAAATSAIMDQLAGFFPVVVLKRANIANKVALLRSGGSGVDERKSPDTARGAVQSPRCLPIERDSPNFRSRARLVK